MAAARPAMDGPELIEGWVARGPRPITVWVEPLARMRSPILAPRGFDPPLTHDESVAFSLPPPGEFVTPSGFALLVAAPLFLLAGWQLALVGSLVVAVAREIESRIPESYSLAGAFLPYKLDDGWPQGVQEDDDVRWNWSAGLYGATKPDV